MLAAKHYCSDLAVFGGKPAFAEKLCTGTPNIANPERFIKRLFAALGTRRLSNNGPYVRELEQQIARLLKVKHCVATCSGTVALEIAIRALGLSGEVIIPSFTFIATAHALQWLGVSPVFLDVDYRTHNLDPTQVARMITPRTAGIIGVHLWGRPCDIDSLSVIAVRHGIPLLFDAAHAFACSHDGRMVGGFGDLEVFSFHATKFFHTFEGGAITTANSALASELRAMRNFGFAGTDKVVAVGTNGKMNEVCAAMGLTGLEDLEEFVAINYRNYKRYQSETEDLPGTRLIAFDERERCNYQFIVLEVDETVTGISRDEILKILLAENIVAKRYFYPGCHRAEPYLSLYPDAAARLPQTERLVKRVLVLPTGAAVGLDEISRVCETIRFVIRNAEEIQKKLLRRTKPM